VVCVHGVFSFARPEQAIRTVAGLCQ